MSRLLACLCAAVAFSLSIFLGGCTTKAAQKAMNKPTDEHEYTGFSPSNLSSNLNEKRSNARDKGEPVTDDMNPEQAVDILVDHLTRSERHYRLPAEDQLRVWGLKQGVAPIIVRKVRMLLKHPDIEVRAPALRLTILYGQNESVGDLIEALGDEHYGMRATAFKALRQRTGLDFGFNPGDGPQGGALARAQALEKWRTWWEKEASEKGLKVARPIGTNVPPRVEGPLENTSIVSREGTPYKLSPAVNEEDVLPPPKR